MKVYESPGEPSQLDTQVAEFAATLDEVGASYAVTGGYVAHLFGGGVPRRVEFVVARLKRDDFYLLWKKLDRTHDAKDAPTPESGYDEILLTAAPLAFKRRGEDATEFAIEFDHSLVLRLTLRDHVAALKAGMRPLPMAPVELQVALDVSIGGPTRERAARALYAGLRTAMDGQLLRRHLDRLGVSQKAFEEAVGEERPG